MQILSSMPGEAVAWFTCQLPDCKKLQPMGDGGLAREGAAYHVGHAHDGQSDDLWLGTLYCLAGTLLC